MTTTDENPRKTSSSRSEVGVKRLNRGPMYLTLAIGGLILFIFMIAIVQRTTAYKMAENDTAGDRENTEDVVTKLTKGRPDGIIPAKAPVLSAPVKDTRPVPPPVEDFNPQSDIVTTIDTSKITTNSVSKNPSDEIHKRADLRIIEYKYDREFEQRQLRDRMAQEARNSVTTLKLQGLDNTLDRGSARFRIAETKQLQGGQNSGSTAQAASMIDSPVRLGAFTGSQRDPNGQEEKQAFLNGQRDTEDYLKRGLQALVSPYEVKQGTIIPGLIVTGISSDLPGRIVGQVSQNVYDTATGRHLLIPQGTRIFGRYDSSVSFGQSRILVAWMRLIYPDGTAINIEGMAGGDQSGRGGFKDRVNNHYLRIYGNAILLSVIGAGIDALRNSKRSDDALANAIRENFGDTFNQVVQQTIQRNLDIQPTLEIRPGYRFVILVEKDMILRPYRPAN